MQEVRETAANIGASALSGLEKTRAVVQEKTERLTADNPAQKEMATHKKEERIKQAELSKQQARQHNALSKHIGGEIGYTVTGDGGLGQPQQQQPATQYTEVKGVVVSQNLPGSGTQVLVDLPESHNVGAGAGGTTTTQTQS